MRGWMVCGIAAGMVSAMVTCTSSDGSPPPSSGGGEAGTGGTPIPIACDEHCSALNPAGVLDYETFRSCIVCGACFDACSPILPSTCADGVERGCSATAPDCAQCAASTCAAEQLPDTTFQGACAAEGNICAANIACVALHNCVTHCLQAGGPPGGGGAGGGGSGGTTR